MASKNAKDSPVCEIDSQLFGFEDSDNDESVERLDSVVVTYPQPYQFEPLRVRRTVNEVEPTPMAVDTEHTGTPRAGHTEW